VNAAEYAAYEEAFAEGMNGITHFSSGSAIRQCRVCVQGEADLESFEGEDTYETHSYFSWSRCDICHSGFGGERTDSHGIYDGALIHLLACDDCVYYAEYGQLDDQTMAEVAGTSLY
jgi:hypothetical protein